MFVRGKPFHPGQILASKAKSLSLHTLGATLGHALANTLAY